MKIPMTLSMGSMCYTDGFALSKRSVMLLMMMAVMLMVVMMMLTLVMPGETHQRSQSSLLEGLQCLNVQ